MSGVSPEVREEVSRLRAEGWTLKRIAAEYGTSHQAVSRWLSGQSEAMRCAVQAVARGLQEPAQTVTVRTTRIPHAELVAAAINEDPRFEAKARYGFITVTYRADTGGVR